MRLKIKFLNFLGLAFCVILLLGWSHPSDKIADALSKKMQVDVSIKSISGGINALSIEKLQIGNPKGSYLPYSFVCDKITLHSALSNYLEQDVVIDEITLDGVYIDLEFDKPRDQEGNWHTIMESTHDSGQELSDEAKGVAPKADATRTVRVNHLILTNIKTDLVYRNKGNVEHLAPIDRIELTDLSSQGGSVINQLVKLVLSQSVKAVYEKQHIRNRLPGGRMRYLLPLRRLESHLSADK